MRVGAGAPLRPVTAFTPGKESYLACGPEFQRARQLFATLSRMKTHVEGTRYAELA